MTTKFGLCDFWGKLRTARFRNDSSMSASTDAHAFHLFAFEVLGRAHLLLPSTPASSVASSSSSAAAAAASMTGEMSVELQKLIDWVTYLVVPCLPALAHAVNAARTGSGSAGSAAAKVKGKVASKAKPKAKGKSKAKDAADDEDQRMEEEEEEEGEDVPSGKRAKGGKSTSSAVEGATSQVLAEAELALESAQRCLWLVGVWVADSVVCGTRLPAQCPRQLTTLLAAIMTTIPPGSSFAVEVVTTWCKLISAVVAPVNAATMPMDDDAIRFMGVSIDEVRMWLSAIIQHTPRSVAVTPQFGVFLKDVATAYARHDALEEVVAAMTAPLLDTTFRQGNAAPLVATRSPTDPTSALADLDDWTTVLLTAVLRAGQEVRHWWWCGLFVLLLC